MPKSSSAIRTPSSRSRCNVASVLSTLAMKMLSVISSSSRCGANPEVVSACRITAGRLGVMNCLGDMFTATLRSSGQAAAWRQDSRITHSPMGTMSPVSSASGMNSAGLIMPSSGCGQRISASKAFSRFSFKE